MSNKTVWERTSVQNLLRHAKSGRFYGRWTMGGKQIWRKLNTDVFTVAKLRLNDEAAKIESLRGSRAAVTAGAGTIGDLMRIYEERVKANTDLKPKSLEARLTGLNKVRKTWPALMTMKPSRVTQAAVADWATRFKAGEGAGFSPPGARTVIRGNSASSVNQAIDSLRLLMDIAVERGAIHANPVSARGAGGRLKKKLVRKKLTLPSTANTRRLFAAIERNGVIGGWGIETADLCRFLFYSGCRVGEVSAVTWGCIDWDRKQLRVKGQKTESSDRVVPLFAELEALLKKILKRREAAAVAQTEPTHAVFRLSECQKSIDTACGAIGITRITHHDFRHLFATRCIESGVDIPTVSRWLGHSDGGVLAMRTYGHLRQEHSAAQAAKVNFGGTPASA